MQKFRFSLCILAASIISGTALCQTTPESPIQALLTEVRLLRVALERSALVAPKIQVTLQRMQLQQDHVSRVSRQLEDLRDQLARSAAKEADAAARMKEVEAHVSQEQDAIRRRDLEDELRVLKPRVEQKTEQQRIYEAQQRARESELVGRLQTEQAKLNELNDRLNALERTLETPQINQP